MVSRAGIFSEPLLPVGNAKPSDAETQELLTALTEAWTTSWPKGLAAMEYFVAQYPASAWSASVEAQLGEAYFECGRYSLALQHWQSAWSATAAVSSGPGKRVADFTLAHWSRLLARLGRVEKLGELIDATRGRILDRAALSQMWVRSREAYGQMIKYPGMSYQCGTFALARVGEALQLRYDGRGLMSVPSPVSGFSLAALAQFSEALNMNLVPVQRSLGSELVVPAVIHWKENHYAAIVAQTGNGLYKVVDPTFGQPRYMTLETIESEGSGFFLVRRSQLAPGYAPVSLEQAQAVYGRGQPNFLWDESDSPSCCECGEAVPGLDGPEGRRSSSLQGAGGCGSCVSALGMPVWRVSEPYINLWLHDEPLRYNPALGAPLGLQINYKQRDETPISTTSGSFGGSWAASWLSIIDSSVYDRYGIFEFTVLLPGGGRHYFSGADGIATNYFSNRHLLVTTNGSGTATSMELQYPNGAVEVYGLEPTNSLGVPSKLFYLTERRSPEGYSTTFRYYEPELGVIRLATVLDPDGRTNVLSYSDANFTNQVTSVTDPYGRTASFGYNESGLLTNVTDVAGLVSSFLYDENGWVTNLVTPYGRTSFRHVDTSQWDPLLVDRYLTITQPDGGNQLYAYTMGNGYEPSPFPTSDIPTNTPIGTLDTGAGSLQSYHWDARQYASLSTNDVAAFTYSDFLKAGFRHWLGATLHGDGRRIDTLSMEREPSPDGTSEGQKTFFDYENKSGPFPEADQGDHIYPAVIARVLPDGSTWYTWFRRNEWRVPTNVVSTYSRADGSIAARTNISVYSSDGIDLLRTYAADGTQLLAKGYNGNHQVLAETNAVGDWTLHTYNTQQQLTRTLTVGGLTTTNTYWSSTDAQNRLERNIDLEIQRTNAYTYFKDRVYTHRDERGLTVTNLWDALGRLTSTLYPDGTTLSNRYDLVGGTAFPNSSGGAAILDLTASKDRLNHWTYFAFDSMRRLVGRTNAAGAYIVNSYCFCGALDSARDYEGHYTYFYYDNAGRLSATVDADNYNLTNNYNLIGQLTRTVDSGGARTTNWFNHQGVLYSSSDAAGTLSYVILDLNDRAATNYDRNGVITVMTRDGLGRVLSRAWRDGGTESYGYSSLGLVAYTNQVQARSSYGYVLPTFF